MGHILGAHLKQDRTWYGSYLPYKREEPKKRKQDRKEIMGLCLNRKKEKSKTRHCKHCELSKDRGKDITHK